MASAWGNSWSVYWGSSWGSVTQEPGSSGIGGGDSRHPGVTREMLRKYFKKIWEAIEEKEVPVELKTSVKEAVKLTAEMVRSDDLSVEKSEKARIAVEKAWFDLQSEKIRLETNYSLISINWILTLQSDLSILYSAIDDEEAAIVLLLSY